MIRSPFPDVDIPDVSLPDLVLARAGEFGDKPALIDAPTGRTITYVQLVEAVRATAAGLAERGFGKGEVFAHYAPNCPEYAVAFHAVATVGGVNTTANPQLTEEELAAQLRDSGARLLVTIPELVEKATAAAKRSGVEEILVYGEADGATPFASLRAAGDPPPVAIDPAEDLVALPYSSGTTGLPKGVMLTHRNLVANLCQVAARVHVKEDGSERARQVAVLPFFHIYGMVSLMNLPLYLGETVVTMPRFDLREFLRVIQDYRITRVALVPPIVLALAKHPLVGEFDLSSLKLVNSGAAPLSAELEVACGKRLGCRMQQGYGLTETSPTTHWVGDELAGTGADQVQGLPDRPGRTGGAPAQASGDHRRGRDPDPRRGGRPSTKGVRGDQRVHHARGGESVRRRARGALQESAGRRDHRRDPEGALRQDPASRADRARTDRSGC
jgi:acyl-CoA synthetase (AMP-forming)/AMP-acid ligase II